MVKYIVTMYDYYLDVNLNDGEIIEATSPEEALLKFGVQENLLPDSNEPLEDWRSHYGYWVCYNRKDGISFTIHEMKGK